MAFESWLYLCWFSRYSRMMFLNWSFSLFKIIGGLFTDFLTLDYNLLDSILDNPVDPDFIGSGEAPPAPVKSVVAIFFADSFTFVAISLNYSMICIYPEIYSISEKMSASIIHYASTIIFIRLTSLIY